MANSKKPPQNSCVCGKSGLSNRNMLECSKCRRCFHEGCVKCLTMPMLAGDQFFIFICSICNFGSEYLARIEMKWADVIHLVLYNLTLEHKRKYFDLDECIMPYLNENWKRLLIIGPVADEKTENKRIQVISTLEKNKKIFRSGKETKQKKSLWSLRVNIPPKYLRVTPTAAKLKESHIIWEFDVYGRKYKLLNERVASEKKAPGINVKSRIKLKLASVTANGRPRNFLEVSKCRGSLQDSENGLKASKKLKKPQSVTFNEDTACYGLLDSMIPVPKDFGRNNHPFKKSGISVHCSKRKIHLDFTKAQEKPNRKRRNGENLCHMENGKHYPFIENINHLYKKSLMNSCKTSEPLAPTKGDLNHNLRITKNENFCIIGKRVTTTGLTQYLLECNR